MSNKPPVARVRRTQGPPLRGGSPISQRVEKKRPGCQIHMVEMVYRPEQLVWRCPEANCSQIALPREDIEDGKGRPRLGEGTLEVINDNPNKKVYLRAPGNNLLLDITEYISRMEQTNGRGGITMELVLRFNNVTEL